MNMYSIPMALVDFIPVIFFGAAAFILQKDLYNKMSKGAYALVCAGTIDVFLAGFLKAFYKLLYAANVCDFSALSTLFFPLQAIGFMLAGLGLVCLVTRSQGKGRVYSVAAPVFFSGTMIFVALMVSGLLGIDFSLSLVAKKMQKKNAVVMFVLSFIFCLAMGYLSSKDFSQNSMHWVAEGVNVFGQAFFFTGTMILHKNGLDSFRLETD